MSLYDTLQASAFFARHNRASGCIFHDGMPYSDDRERVPLVTAVLHYAVDNLLREEFPGKKAGMLRKRLALNPVALEVYNDKTFVASYWPEEWPDDLRIAITAEVKHWIAEEGRRGYPAQSS